MTRILLVAAPAIAGEIGPIVAALESAGLEIVVGTANDLARPDAASFDVIAGPGSLRCDAALFARCPRLKALVSIGVGQEGFDLRAAAERGIAIAGGASDESIAGMAEATILLMLALCYDLPGAERACAAGQRRDVARARRLGDLVVGLIGYGAIGRAVAGRLRAWDVTVLAHAPSLAVGKGADGVDAVPLDLLLARSDIVSLHAALTPASRHLIDHAAIGRMKSGAMLVNTARGGLVDEPALAQALVSGHLAAAALDCLETEPLPADSPLRRAPNCILTPHQIGHTAKGAASIVATLIANICRVAG